MPDFADLLGRFGVGVLCVWLIAGAIPPGLSGPHGWLHWLPGLYPHLQTPMVDGVIWTLNVEMRYYAAMALAFWLMRRSLPRVLMLFAASGVMVALLMQLPLAKAQWQNSAFLMSGLYYFRYFLFMSVGLAVHLYHRGSLRPRQAWGVGAVLLISFYVIWRTMPAIDGAPVSSYALMAACFLLAYRYRASVFFRLRGLNFIATISYSIYALHAVFGFSLLVGLRMLGAPVWLALLLVPALVFGASFLLWYVIEQPSHQLAQKIARRTDASPIPASVSL